MNALISGRAGRALLLDAGSLTSFDVDDPSRLVPRAPADFAYLFGEMQDLRVVENTDVKAVQRELKQDSDSALALELALISLDAELPDDIRQEAMEGLDELLPDTSVAERLENILYARPLPEDADLTSVLQFCNEHVVAVSTFLRRLEEREPFISEVSEAWDSIPTTVFGDYDQRAEFLQTAVREGLFRTLVLSREAQSTTSTFLLNAGLNNSIKQLRNHRQVLQHWTTSFRQSAETPAVNQEIEEEPVTEASPRRRHGRRIGINRTDVLREVNERKAIISAAMARRDFIHVRNLVDDLVDFQLASGETKHLAKSLCDLALEAKELGIVLLQLELTERSINIAPDDYWSWTQYGDALLSLNRLDDALGAYEQSENFGAGVLARTGKGEALKAKGALDEALSAFNEVIREHPENVVAKTGRAEVLKAQGQLPAALAAFDEVIREHPENVVAKTGRAEVLKAQGQLPAALAAFDEVIRDHPENVVPKTGRAEVLKAQGQLPAALAAFDEVIRDHPESVFAKNGRAEVLKAQGQLPDAFAAFDEVIRDHPENVFAKNGRAEVLKAQGQLPAALAAFDEVIRDHPENVVAKNGRAEVLKAQGRLPAALAAFDEVIRDHPENVFAKSGRAEVLKAQGQLPAALAAFDEVIRDHPENVVAKTGRAEVLKAQGQLPAALAAFDEVIRDHPEDVVPKTGRAEVLKAQGQLPAALAAFDEVIRDHPENVVAKNGRAEVLKAQGQLPAALVAFDEVIRDHPENVIAKNGRSCVLAALRRYEEALADLPNDTPKTLGDWIGFHIRGMIMLRRGEIDEAIRIFRQGVEDDPIPLGKQYFHTALSVALMRHGEYESAKKVLSNVMAQELQPQVNVLLMHCFGENDQTAQASEAFESISAKPWSISDELIEELHRRYVLKQPPQRSDDWVFDEEIGSILVVANQQGPISNYVS